jgi:GxxExxY protein
MDDTATQKRNSDDLALLGFPLTRTIIGCAMRVHQRLGPGLLEVIYRQALLHELKTAGLRTLAEVPIDVEYDGIQLGCGFRADMIVESKVILELKAVERILPLHAAQLLTYMKTARLRVGLLINFNAVHLRHGLKRIVLSRC